MDNYKLKTLKSALVRLEKEISDINIQGGVSAAIVAALELQQQHQQ